MPGMKYILLIVLILNELSYSSQIIMPDAYNPGTGVFHCRFWRLGQWIDVYTDDFLPCDENGFVGCKSNNYLGEMWVPLIEKAYAK